MRSVARAFVVCCLLVPSLGAETTALQSATLDQLLKEYRTGDANAAVEAFSRWPGPRVEAEDARSASADPFDDAALALLHAETGFRGDLWMVQPPAYGPVRSTHFLPALEIVKRLASRSESGEGSTLRRFLSKWCIVTGGLWMRTDMSFSLDDFSEFADRLFDDDAEAQLFVGSAHTSVMGPDVEELDGFHLADIFGPVAAAAIGQAPTRIASSSHGIFNADRARLAEKAFRHALDLNPLLIEARVRLGQMLFELDRNREARQELERAVRDAQAERRATEGYWAAMFLGELDEHEQRPEDAHRAYENARTFRPLAPGARIALGALQIRSGRMTDGWTTIREMFGSPTRATAPEIDPWVWYRDGQFWQASDRIAELRAMVHQPPGARDTSSLALAPASFMWPPASVTAPAPIPAAASSVQSPNVFRTAVEGVRIDVTVVNGGRSVLDLTADQFEVLDNGVRQQVDSTARVGNLSVGIVLDWSHSTAPYAADIFNAARAVTGALQLGDVTSVVTADDRVTLRLRAARDPLRVQEALRPAPFEWSRTALWDATMAAGALAIGESGRPLVVVLSDLADNASWMGQSQVTARPARDRAAMADLFRRSGVVIDLLCGPDWHPAVRSWPYLSQLDLYSGSRANRETTDPTGGLRLDLSDSKSIDRLTRQFDEMRAGYVMTFTPKGVKTGDGWHKLTVRLKSAKGTVTARPGYFSTSAKER